MTNLMSVLGFLDLSILKLVKSVEQTDRDAQKEWLESRKTYGIHTVTERRNSCHLAAI